MKLIVKAKILLVILFGLTGIMAQGQELDSLFNAANKLYQQEEYMKALDLYQQIEKQEMQSSELFFNMGNIYYRTNQVAHRYIITKRP